MIFPWIYFLNEEEQVLVETFTRRWTMDGPGMFFAPPFYRVTKRRGITLGPTEYLRVRDRLTGEYRNIVGPTFFFGSATDEIVERMKATPLKHNQYVKVLNKETGEIRVERGEGTVYLEPTETFLGKVQNGINVDDEVAVLIRDTRDGNLELITEHQVFFPSAHQDIVEVHPCIRLEDHETVVIKDKNGQYVFKHGTEEDRAFFLEPYCELVRLSWSTGIHKNKRDLHITHFDGRPKFMWYEFQARTKDNVEIDLGITFFWQITDIEAMIKTTDDAPGDLCSHARSIIIQAVSKVNLEKFLAEFNTIVQNAIYSNKDGFYKDRGIKIHAVEVRAATCKDPATQQILQEIIQETTNRINQLQKQESENEVKLKQIQGDIEVEEQKGRLLEIQQEHVRKQAQMEGEAEAEWVNTFLSGLGEEVSIQEKLALFNTLRKRDVLSKLSEGKAQLYFTPSDVDLRIVSQPGGGGL